MKGRITSVQQAEHEIKVKLFRAYVVTDVHSSTHVYHDVCLQFYRCDRETPPAPFEQLIDSSEPDFYSKEYITGLFTAEEVEALREYIGRVHDLNVSSEEESLPIPSNIMGPWQCPIGGTTDISLLWKEECYDLPFKVAFFYDLRFGEAGADIFVEPLMRNAEPKEILSREER